MLALGIIFYISSILFGISLVNYFFGRRIEEILVKYAFSFPIGFAFATYLVVIFEAVGGSFNDYCVLAASIIMLAFSYLLYRGAGSREMFDWKLFKKQVNRETLFYALITIVFVLLAAMQVVGVNNTPRGIGSGGNYGTDFLFHVSIGNSLVYSGWPPRLLYANGASNVFPFITDFYTSILMFNGIGPVTALYLMNMLLWFSIVVITVYFVSLITKRKVASVFGFLLFLLCGVTLNVLILAATGVNLPNSGLAGLISHFNLYRALGFQLFNFANPITNNFAPQHDLLLGFPYALIILSVLYLAFFEGAKEYKHTPKEGIDKLFVLIGLMVGLMPLVHPFSLVFVFIFVVVAFIYSMMKGGRKSRLLNQWVPFGAVAVIVGVPELLFIHSSKLASGFYGLVLNGWMWYSPTTSLPSQILLHLFFWLETFGPIVVVGILGLYYFRKRIVVFVPAFIALLVVNLVRFSPSFGDSNKITIYFLLFMAAAAVFLMSELWKRSTSWRVVVAFAFLIIIVGGVAQEVYALANGPTIAASNAEINASSWILANTSSNSSFVDSCYNTVFALSSSLAGRRTLMEIEPYIGLVGLQNYDIGQVDQQIQSFMIRPSCSLVSQYNISYVMLENISTFAPIWCDQVNYSAFSNSTDFTLVKSVYYNLPPDNDKILIYKSLCG